jgi:hypothetical protein
MTRHNKAAQFYDAVDRMTEGGSTVMEAIVEYCYKNDLEVESVVPLVTKNANLVSKLRDEAESVNAIERVGHLPV